MATWFQIQGRLEAGERVGLLMAGRWEWGKFTDFCDDRIYQEFELEGGRRMHLQMRAVDAISFWDDKNG